MTAGTTKPLDLLSNRMRDLADELAAHGGGEAAALCREAATAIDDKDRRLARYRWKVLAGDLVICLLQTRHSGRETTTHQRVIHRKGCPRTPTAYDWREPTTGRADGKEWQVMQATGNALADVLAHRQPRLCKVCKPNVDPATVIDA